MSIPTISTVNIDDSHDIVELTIHDVIRRSLLVQKMKLLFLQDVIIEDNNITIINIKNEKKLIEIFDEYREHYDDVMKYYNTITIYNLEDDSLLCKGLQKEIINFMVPFTNTNEFGKIIYKKDTKYTEYMYSGGWSENVKKWTEDENTRLERLYMKDVSNKDIAEMMGRTESSIKEQILKLSL